MARKTNTSKEKRRSKRKDRVDHTRATMATIRVLTLIAAVRPMLGEPVEIGQYHDYLAANAHECVIDPSPEDIARIVREM
jgi:hypothetical protein